MKIIIVGNKNVGKTTLIKKIMYDIFDSKYEPTKMVKIYEWGQDEIWDCDNNSIYYINANRAIIVADKHNLQSIDYYYNNIREIAGPIEIDVVITKMDLGKKMGVKDKKYIYISNKNNSGIEIKNKLKLL